MDFFNLQYAELVSAFGKNIGIAIPSIIAAILAGRAMAKYSYNAFADKTLDAIMMIVRSIHYSIVLLVFSSLILPSIGMKIVDNGYLDIELYRSWYMYVAIFLSMVTTYGFYIRNHIRTGIRSIHEGQIKNAKSMGMSDSDIAEKVTLPQAMRSSVDSIQNELTDLTKSTVVASAYGFSEILATVRSMTALDNAHYLEYIIVMTVMFLLTLTIQQKFIKFMWKKLF